MNQEAITALQTLQDNSAALLTTIQHTAGFTGFIAGLVLNVPDEEWRRVLHDAATPCGEAGCQCHVRKAQLYNTLDFLRDEAQARFR